MSSPTPSLSRMTLESAAPSSTLEKLPKELLSHISTFLDTTSLLQLSRTCQSFLPLASSARLWSVLNLRLPNHYAETPDIPTIATSNERYETFASVEANKVEMVRRAALREKLKTIVVKAGEKDWAAVKGINMRLYPGSAYLAIPILDFASSTLQVMEIRGPAVNAYQGTWLIPSFECLVTKLIDSQITFSALKRLILGPRSMWTVRSIAYFLLNSPSLTDLDLDFSLYPVQDPNSDSDAPFPHYEEDTRTNLRQLRVTFPSGLATVVPLIWTLRGILKISAELRQLDVEGGELRGGEIADLIVAVAPHKGLEDVRLPIKASDFFEGEDDREGFGNVKRLVLASDSGMDMFADIPSLPNLHTLFFDRGPSWAPLRRGVNIPSIPPPHLPTFTIFNDGLHACPHLHIIHTLHGIPPGGLDLFDRLEQYAGLTISGKISSFCDDQEEVISAVILADVIPVPDEEGALKPTLENGENPEGVAFRVLEKARWHIFDGEYLGAGVPLELKKRVFDAGSVPNAERGLRGVKVNEEARALLMEWYEQVAESTSYSMGEVEAIEQGSE